MNNQLPSANIQRNSNILISNLAGLDVEGYLEFGC